MERVPQCNSFWCLGMKKYRDLICLGRCKMQGFVKAVLVVSYQLPSSPKIHD
eukprot:COSAG05_NODE_3052_length_2381_cov_3.333041_4_plen_51_part_01